MRASGLHRVDLGCGSNKVRGTIGLDLAPLPGVDILANLACGLPLRDNSVDEIYAVHVLEHFDDFIAIMEEIWRVCAPAARLFVRVPHSSCSYATWKDPTHRRGMQLSTFTYFDDTYYDGAAFAHYTRARFRIERARLNVFAPMHGRERVPPAQRLVQMVIQTLSNHSRGAQYLCERYWAPLIGIEEVELVMTAIKDPSQEDGQGHRQDALS